MKSAICSLLFLTQQSMSAGGAWNYHDMAAWSQVNSMCAANDNSPIDIVTDELVYDSSVCTADFQWNVDFTKQTFKVVNNGHGISLTPAEKTSDETSRGHFKADNISYTPLTYNDNAIASFPNYFQPLGSDHNKFCLHGFHFHWGTTNNIGSEHLMDGHQFPLELHFVHYSCHHSDVGAVLGQFPTHQSVQDAAAIEFNDVHQLAVIGLFFELSEEDNPAFDAFLSDDILKKVEVQGHDNVVADDVSIGALIGDYAQLESAGFYAYEGSLTTPPCTDIVRWHVMKHRGTISLKQLNKLRTLKSGNSTVNHLIGNNFREVQDNVNAVYGCFAAPPNEADAKATERAVVWAVAVFSILLSIVVAIGNYWHSHRHEKLAKVGLINDDHKKQKKQEKKHSTGHGEH